MKMPRFFSLFIIGIIGFMASSLVSCKSDRPEVQVPAPQIFSFPPRASEGSAVVISGKNFSPDKTKNSVKLNGLAVEVTEVNAAGTEMTILVPTGATSGKITVTVNGQTATSGTDLIVDPGGLGITTVIPGFGAAGTAIEITGTNFKPGTKVFFESNIEATNVVVVSPTKITAQVPTGAKSGKILVKFNDLGAISPLNFYMPPIISSVSTNTGLPGTTVVDIEGTNFTTQTKIFFGTAEATPSYLNDHFITVTVPAGATTGKIKVTHAGLEAESASIFTVMQPLSITSVTPDHGAQGTLLTIQGTHFQSGAQVVFEWGTILKKVVAATDVTILSSTELTARVPATVPTYPLTIKVISGDRMGYYNMTFYSAPTITSIAPLQASHYPNMAGNGNTVIISGTNFTSMDQYPNETMVQFGNVTADIVSLSYGYIEVTPPAGLPASCKISVTIKGMTVTSTDDFSILPSVVRHDTRGTIGSNYTIEGNFLPDAELYINGLKMTNFSEKTTSKMVFKVPTGTTNGPVVIKQSGRETTVFNFTL